MNHQNKTIFAFIAATLVVSGFFVATPSVFAAIVSVTPASGGSAISADNTTSTFTSLTGPIIKESSVRDVGLGTIILTAPTGFVFNTSGSVTATVFSGTDNTNCTGRRVLVEHLFY